MEHNRASNIKKRPINIYADSKWNGSDVRTGSMQSLRRQGLMDFNPRASWNKEQIAPMHWNPRASWNTNTASDVMHRRLLANPFTRDAPVFIPASHANMSFMKCKKRGHMTHNCPNRGGKSRKHKKSSRRSNHGRKSRKN